MSIRAKLILAFATLAVLILLHGVVDYAKSHRATERVLEAYRNSASEIAAADGMLDTVRALRDLGTPSNAAESEEVVRLLGAFDGWLEDARAATGNMLESERVRGIVDGGHGEFLEIDLLRRAEAEFDAYREARRTGADERELRMLLEERVDPVLREYRTLAHAAVGRNIDRVQDESLAAQRTIAITLVATLAAVLAAFLVLAKVVLDPVKKLADVTGEIADGNRRQRLKLHRADEFAEVETNFNRMLDALERANASREGFESEARSRALELERLFSLSVDLLAVSTIDGQFLRVSDSFRDTLGYMDGELIQRPFMEFVHPDDVESTVRAMERLGEGITVRHHENRYRTKNGRWVTLSWTAAPMLEAGLIYAVARDITDEKEAARRGAEANERLLRFERSLLKLRDCEPDDVGQFCRFATEECARALEVERVSVWFFSDKEDMIVCEDWFVRSAGRHGSGMRITNAACPEYFAAIARGKALILEDALTSPFARELGADYIEPGGIRALLDVPIRTGDRRAGVLCCEHVGGPRAWTAEEERFARSAAGSVMLALETVARRKNEEDLYRLNATLEQRVAERTTQLAENEQRFRQIIEQVQDYAIVVLDPDGRVATWNAGAARLKGYTAEEIVGRDFSVFYTDEDREAGLPARLLREAAETGRSRAEGWRQRKDGTKFWAEVFLSANRDAAGNLRGFAKITHDLTARRQAEGELREREEQFRSAMEYSAIGMALVALDGRWLRVNRALTGIIGYTEDELLSRDFQAITHPDDLDRDMESVRRLLAGEISTYSMEKRYIHKDGHLVWVMLSASLVRDAEGAPKHFISQIQDITDRREAEESLRLALEEQKRLALEAQAGARAKSEFLAVMSHELRTPMNGVLGFAELLVNLPDLPPEAHDYAETIARSGASLLRILDDILDLSRLEAGRLEIEPAPFSLDELLRGIVILLGPIARNRGVDVRSEIASGVPDRLVGDAGRLRQVMLNLAGNALKFTDTGVVTLGARPGGDGLELFVRDTGCGIPSDRIESVFEPFVQVDSSTSRQHGGAGLGLSISRRLVSLMGGKLRVTSQEGEGTEFWATVPLEEASRSAEPAELPAVAPVIDSGFSEEHPLRILVVEDDRVNRKLVVTMLRKFGYDAISAEDGLEAVEVFEAERPDCILMDLQMPRMDGIAAAARIREIERAAPGTERAFILALTANTSPHDRERCVEAGMDDYLNKPVKRDVLARILASAAASRRAAR